MIIKKGLRIAIDRLLLFGCCCSFYSSFVDGFHTVGEISVCGPLLGTLINVPRAVCLEIMGFTGIRPTTEPYKLYLASRLIDIHFNLSICVF
jgi:hypothetical protein